MVRALLFGFIVFWAIQASSCGAAEGQLRFKNALLKRLTETVPALLASQDPATGRFGKGIFIVGDQNVIYPLAVVWATQGEQNPYYHDSEVLKAIMDGGDALIDDADETGQWVFRKKDGSTWGNIYMPWTYSRWVRAYGLIRDAMPPERRDRWEKALLLGYSNIARTQLERVHNIPAHHAMGLYIAGTLFGNDQWREQAAAFLRRVAEEQAPGGYWSEHCGPVVSYNFVYVDALGTYYALSRDEAVLPALERAAQFHSNFTYPDGSRVETVDERNPYSAGIVGGNVGFSWTPEGRGYLDRQWRLREKAGKAAVADEAASFLLYGQEGDLVPTAAEKQKHTYLMKAEGGEGSAFVLRDGPWFIVMSAYVCPISTSRWIEDRQNLVSVFHDSCGLILGGGNTKLQPLWSTFTAGDTSLLKHTPGDESPDFLPPQGITHVPDTGAIFVMEPPMLSLGYGDERTAFIVQPLDEKRARLVVRGAARGGAGVQAHLTLLPQVGKPLATEKTESRPLGEEPLALAPGEAGGWIEHAGWRLSLPPQASVTWPVLPHNPYRKDGHATLEEGRIVVSLPFSPDRQEYELILNAGN